MTTAPTLADQLRAIARDLIEDYPTGIPASAVTGFASRLQGYADGVARLEHMLSRRLTAGNIPPRTPPRAAEPAPAPHEGPNILLFGPRTKAAPSVTGDVA